MNPKITIFERDLAVLLLGFAKFQFNSGLAKVAVQCSADTFVVNQSLVLRINICGENRHLRQARKRQDVKKTYLLKILAAETAS